MPWIERVAVDAVAELVAALIVGVLLLMAVGAQRLQLAEHEPVPIAAMWGDVVGDCRWPRETSFGTTPTNRLDLQLISSPVFPALQPVPTSPVLGRMRGSAGHLDFPCPNGRLQEAADGFADLAIIVDVSLSQRIRFDQQADDIASVFDRGAAPAGFEPPAIGSLVGRLACPRARALKQCCFPLYAAGKT
jgi:hypothetical protein